MTEARQLIAALCGRLEAGGLGPAAVTALLDAIWLVNTGFIQFDTISLQEEIQPAPPADPTAAAPQRGENAAPPAAEPVAHAGAPDTPAQDPPAATAPQRQDAAAAEAPLLPAASTREMEPLMYVAVRSGSGKALPARRAVLLAAPPPLGRTLELERAFSPLRTTRATARSGLELDAEQTARHYAATRRILPQWRARRGRWLNLLVLIERSPTMRFWQASARSLVPIAARGSGALAANTFYLERAPSAAGPGAPRLTDRSGRSRRLDSVPGQTLLLYLTDTTGPGWLTGEIPALLGHWAGRASVLVLHLLPRGFWSRTALGNVLPLSAWQRPAAGEATPRPQIPLVCYLGPRAIRTTVCALAGQPRGVALQLYSPETEETGYTESIADKFASIDASEFDQLAARAVAEPDALEIDALWNEFCSDATPATQRLAAYLAPAPLVMPVMRMIERSLVPEAAPWQIAELVMSGLIRRWRGCASQDVSRMEYEFLPGIRERLLQLSSHTEQWDVIDLISNYVERRFGRAREFEAYCSGRHATGAAPDPQGEQDREFAPFSRVAAWFGALQPQPVIDDTAAGVEPDSSSPPAQLPPDEPIQATASAEPESENPGIAEIVLAAVKTAQAALQRNDLLITSRIDQRIEASPVDGGRTLVEILSDLVMHAASYTRDGTISVSAELARKGETYQDISLLVRDTGGANPAVVRNRLLGSSTHASPHRAEIERRGGSMGVRGDRHSETTTVWIRLPVESKRNENAFAMRAAELLARFGNDDVAANDGPGQDFAEYAATTTRTKQQGPVRVLLVYNDPQQRDELSRPLWWLKIEHESVIARESVLSEIDLDRFDLVIAPGSGSRFDLSAVIRERRQQEARLRKRQVPVIVLLESADGRTDWLSRGASDCIQLPISSTTIKRLLRRWTPRFEGLQEFVDPEQEETVLVLTSSPVRARNVLEALWDLGLVPIVRRDIETDRTQEKSFALILLDLDDDATQTKYRVGFLRFVEERDLLSRAKIIGFTADTVIQILPRAAARQQLKLDGFGLDDFVGSDAPSLELRNNLLGWLSSGGKEISRHYASPGISGARVAGKTLYLVGASGRLEPRRRTLENMGLSVVMVRSSANALAMARFEKFDMFLVDCRMDGLGERVIEQLLTSPANIVRDSLIVALVGKDAKKQDRKPKYLRYACVHSLSELRPLIPKLRSRGAQLDDAYPGRTVDLLLAGELLHRPGLSPRKHAQELIRELNAIMTRLGVPVVGEHSVDHKASEEELKRFCARIGAGRLWSLNTRLAAALSRKDQHRSMYLLRCMEAESEAVAEVLRSFVE